MKHIVLMIKFKRILTIFPEIIPLTIRSFLPVKKKSVYHLGDERY